MLDPRPEPIANVEQVFDLGLCSGCGTCAGICPRGCISIVPSDAGAYLRPRVDMDECIQCGLCMEACPGESVDFDDLNTSIFGVQPEETLIGNAEGFWLAWSTDDDVRRQAASGGVVSELASVALESGLVDGVIASRLVSGFPLSAEPFVARTRQEVISSSGSLYFPVSTNTIMARVKEEEGRFALIGLPCHIEGARKVAQLDSDLDKRIRLCIGIFCVKTPSFHATEYYLGRKGIDPRSVAGIRYRGMGWPGKIRVVLQDGSERIFARRVKWWNLPALADHSAAFGLHYFEPPRCRLCIDETNELADIALGDPWLPELMGIETLGKSLCVARSATGENLLREAVRTRRIAISESSLADVIGAQSPSLMLKKSLSSSAAAARRFGQGVPRYSSTAGNSELDSSLGSYVAAHLDNLEAIIGSSRFLWPFIPLITLLIVLPRAVHRKFRRYLRQGSSRARNGEVE